MARRKRWWAGGAILVLTCTVPGCGTIFSTLAEGPRPLGGGAGEPEVPGERTPLEGGFLAVFRPFMLVDAPLNLALDLVLLPVSLPLALLTADEPEPPSASGGGRMRG